MTAVQEHPIDVHAGEPVGGTTVVQRPMRLFWERFREDKAAVFGLVVVCVLLLLAIFGGPIAARLSGHSNQAIYQTTMENEFGSPLGPNNNFWFGADGEAHDLFVRTMYGARTSLLIGVGASLLAVTVGLVVGMAAGFYGGLIDSGFSRVGDVMLSLPTLLIAIGIVASCSLQGCFGGFIEPGIRVVIMVIALFTWPYIARLVRGYTLSIRQREFVEASRALGASNRRIIYREVLPNLIGPMIVFTTLLIPQNILFEAALSYLGLGVPSNVASWGALLRDAQTYYVTAWWLMLFPGLFLVLTTLAFNLLGDGLRDALDVRADR
jgi:peptide/nickel transport system permease protein